MTDFRDEVERLTESISPDSPSYEVRRVISRLWEIVFDIEIAEGATTQSREVRDRIEQIEAAWLGGKSLSAPGAHAIYR